MESSRIICGSPMQVDTLTESQLSDFELALQDVLGSIADDPIAAEAFAEISALKATRGVTARRCGVRRGGGPVRTLDGSRTQRA